MHLALIGKLLPNTLLFLLVGWTIVFYFYGYMHFPCNSGITDMLILMTLFILSCEALGVLMITILPTLRMGLSFDGYNLTNAWPYLAALAGFILLSIITTPILKRELLTVRYVP